MIKLIIFDLDGVLIDSKDTHFEALNRALRDYSEEPITYKEHISIYDGKPTRKKLSLRGIDTNKHDLINTKKQEYTYTYLKDLKQNKKLVDLFKKLKEENYIIHVASNSIRDTVKIVLTKLGLKDLIDLIMSNQDVKEGKPHPEIFLRCMLNASIGPKETLILEDSYVGRKGAFNSGAFLCGVKDTEEISYPFIRTAINKCEGQKLTWKGNNMNIVIPMAGAGSRFKSAGYLFPKPIIDVMGKPMISWITDSLNIEGNYIFLVRKEHLKEFNIRSMLNLLIPGCTIVEVDELTEGAACTVLLAKEFINNEEQLVIANSDQYIEWDSSDFMYQMQSKHIDGGLLTFDNTNIKWSYAKLDEDNFVSEVREKEVISRNATCGIYHFKKGSDFVKYAEQMIKKNLRINNEFYVAPVYNEAISDGKKFKIYDVDSMEGLGTPEDLNLFINKRVKKHE